MATKNGGKRPSRRAPSPPKQAEPPATAAPRRRKRAERTAGAPTTSQAKAGAPAASRDLSAPTLAGAERPSAESPPAEEYGPDEDETPPERPERARGGRSNPLGTLIEHQFTAPGSPARSYSDLERRSGISREALSRYVTLRRDRRRSPTIDTLVAIADAMHLSLLAVCRAAAASVRGVPLPPANVQHTREAVVSSLIDGLSDDQFSAVVELLRQMHPRGPGAS